MSCGSFTQAPHFRLLLVCNSVSIFTILSGMGQQKVVPSLEQCRVPRPSTTPGYLFFFYPTFCIWRQSLLDCWILQAEAEAHQEGVAGEGEGRWAGPMQEYGHERVLCWTIGPARWWCRMWPQKTRMMWLNTSGWVISLQLCIFFCHVPDLLLCITPCLPLLLRSWKICGYFRQKHRKFNGCCMAIPF